MKAQLDRFDRERDQASARMFTDGRDWPHFVLPVKNYKINPEERLGTLGIIATPAKEKMPLVIYETNLWAPDFEHSKQYSYESVLDALNAGWVVD